MDQVDELCAAAETMLRSRWKGRAMGTHNGSGDRLDCVQTAFADADPKTSEQRSARSLNSSIRSEQQRGVVPGERLPPSLRTEMGKLLADIIYSLVSDTLKKMVGRTRGSSPRRHEPIAVTELGLSGEPLSRLLTLLNETVLRVGPLELDLIDRTAKRGDRHINLRPREFQLLKYMMQRNDRVLTRATLLKGVWQYKFVPRTNLVDVQIGLLRRKVDGANEAPMIRNVRGVGFVLNAAPLSQGSSKNNDVAAVSRGPVRSSLGTAGTSLRVCLQVYERGAAQLPSIKEPNLTRTAGKSI